MPVYAIVFQVSIIDISEIAVHVFSVLLKILYPLLIKLQYYEYNANKFIYIYTALINHDILRKITNIHT